jgi:uncharacterized protein (TIGR00369 family)
MMATSQTTNILPLILRVLAGEQVDGFPMTLPPPVAATVGFDVVSVEHGAAVFSLDIQQQKHANPMGTVHGGILVDLADAAMGLACASRLERGESFTTIELKINYFRPVVSGRVEAHAKVVNASKTVVYIESDIVFADGGKLIAKVNSSCLILRGEHAKQR